MKIKFIVFTFLSLFLLISNAGSRPSLLQIHPNLDEQLGLNLQPLDILLSKNSGPSSRLIPGYFSHSAVYLGNEQQLKELGVWQQDFFKPYRADIQEGRVIIEAIAPNVRLVSIQDFLSNSQEILSVRKSNSLVNFELVSNAYERGLQQMFKPYDYVLDLRTSDRIFCGELVSLIYKNVTWPIRSALGISSLKPDNFAEVVFHLDSNFHFGFHYSATSTSLKASLIAEKIGYVWRDINGAEIVDSTTQGYYWDRQVRPLGVRIVKRAEGIKTVICGSPALQEALTLFRAHAADSL